MSQMRHTTMAEKYKGKYRIESNRLRGWDYSRNGHYFLTIVTAGRQLFFGNVNNGEMILNEIGQIVHDEFVKSFEIRDELFMGPFILMPNHLHAIVTLEKTECTGGHVEANGHSSLHDRPTPQFVCQPQSISSFVAGFKSATINRIDDWIDANGLQMQKFNRQNPLWQANYYDHIIRNETEYQNISEYIANNPIKWEGDMFK